MMSCGGTSITISRRLTFTMRSTMGMIQRSPACLIVLRLMSYRMIQPAPSASPTANTTAPFLSSTVDTSRPATTKALDNPNSHRDGFEGVIAVWGPAAAHSLAVVTRDAKFIYWPWADTGFEATEELYLTTKDPLELKNEIANPESAALLKEMRKRYDKYVSLWQKEAVPFNDYQRFGQVFDRSISWSKKDGKRVILMATDRPVKAFDWAGASKSLEKNLSLLKLVVDAETGKGEGVMAAGAELVVDKNEHLKIETPGTQPIRFTSVKQKHKKNKN